jgi:hypothetical protein
MNIKSLYIINDEPDMTNEFVTKLCDCCKLFRFNSSDLVWELTETSSLEIGQTTNH